MQTENSDIDIYVEFKIKHLKISQDYGYFLESYITKNRFDAQT